MLATLEYSCRHAVSDKTVQLNVCAPCILILLTTVEYASVHIELTLFDYMLYYACTTIKKKE